MAAGDVQKARSSGGKMNADELAQFLANGGGQQLALEQREAFIAEPERQQAARAERERRRLERPQAAKGK